MTTILIPARGGSKRLGSKNLLALPNGRSLVTQAVYTALQVTDDVWVSTDSSEIAWNAHGAGAMVTPRAKHTSHDLATTASVVLEWMGRMGWWDTVPFIMQCTTPELVAADIEAIARAYGRNPTPDGVVSINPNGERKRNGLYKPTVDMVHRGVCFTERSLSVKTQGDYIDIDTQEDFDEVCRRMSQ